MELREELIEKVERYLSGKLSREEVKEENATDLSNEEIDEAVELFETSRSLIELSGLREDLQSIHEEYIADNSAAQPKADVKKGNNFNTWIWATLAVAAAVTFISVFTGVFKSGSPEFEEYFTKYPDLISVRGNESSIAEAMRLYNSENYQAALQEFLGIKSDSMNESVLFYQSVAAIAVKEFQLAVDNLKKLSGIADNQYWQQTNWYLGLALWQNGQLKEAREIFSGIKPGEYRYDDAAQLAEGL